MTTINLFVLRGCCLVIILLFLSPACKKKAPDEPEFPVLKTCKPVAAAGRLTYESGTGVATYTTSGGGIIEINQWLVIRLTHTGYQGFSIELWGGDIINGQEVLSANHENLNGKHIKDRHGSRRTILFPDGAKLTLVTDGEYGQLLEISIYDGDAVHHINPTCRTLELSAINRVFADHFDSLQADGEASAIEFTDDGLLWVNIYQEDSPGNRVEKRVPLSSIVRDKPNQINDYYDDPRLMHT